MAVALTLQSNVGSKQAHHCGHFRPCTLEAACWDEADEQSTSVIFGGLKTGSRNHAESRTASTYLQSWLEYVKTMFFSLTAKWTVCEPRQARCTKAAMPTPRFGSQVLLPIRENVFTNYIVSFLFAFWRPNLGASFGVRFWGQNCGLGGDVERRSCMQ